MNQSFALARKAFIAHFQPSPAIAAQPAPHYRNAGQSITDLGEGRIDVALVPLSLALGQAAANKVKLLAVTNVERSPAAAATPMVAEPALRSKRFVSSPNNAS